MAAPLRQAGPWTAADEFPVTGMDAVVFAVGNARQAAHFYSTAFGMRCVAYRGPETGCRDEAAYVLESGSARFVFRGPVRAGTALGRHVAAHGDGVVDLAIGVPSAEAAYEYAVAHGATGLDEPEVTEDAHGKVVLAAIATYGDTRHTLVERANYSGPYLPGYVAAGPRSLPLAVPAPGPFFTEIDHCVGNVELGRMDEWVGFYQPGHGLHQHEGVRRGRHRHRVLGADEQGGRRRQPQGQVPDQRAGGRQEEVADRRVPGVLRRPRRPAHRAGHRRHRGRGPRHAGARAWTSSTPRTATTRRSASGSATPGSRSASCSELKILADRDEDGYLLQIFTKPVQDRPTVFFELIERHGSEGFGKGNFKALFEAIEREQARRGNL